MRWLRRFLYSDDPVVKLVSGIGELEAELARQVLEDNGIGAASKNTDYLAAYGVSSANAFDVFVKQSDAERAREVLALDGRIEADRYQGD